MKNKETFYIGKRFLVTGGLGYIGASLTHELAALGAQVTVLDSSHCPSVSGFRAALNVDLVAGDVRDADLMRQLLVGKDGCFHLAALSRSDHYRDDSVKAQEVNTLGTSTVAKASFDELGIPLVFASSAAVYGSQTELPITEKSVCAPQSQYGKDKLRCELDIAEMARSFGCRATCLRLFNVCGVSPFDTIGSGVLAKLASSVAHNEPFHVHGTGKQTRDYVHIRDVVEAFMAVMGDLLNDGSNGIEIYNVCSGSETSLLELINISGLNRNLCQFVQQSNPGVLRSIGSNGRFLSNFGPHNFVRIQDTVTELLRKV